MIGQIRHYINLDATKKIVHSLVISRLDNLNSLIYNIPDVHFKKLRRVQCAAARLVLLSKEQWYMLPLLKQLHWLPIAYRLKFKLLAVTFKALKGDGPVYLTDLLKPVAHTHMSLRSASQNLLQIPFTKFRGLWG